MVYKGKVVKLTEEDRRWVRITMELENSEEAIVRICETKKNFIRVYKSLSIDDMIAIDGFKMQEKKELQIFPRVICRINDLLYEYTKLNNNKFSMGINDDIKLIIEEIAKLDSKKIELILAILIEKQNINGVETNIYQEIMHCPAGVNENRCFKGGLVNHISNIIRIIRIIKNKYDSKYYGFEYNIKEEDWRKLFEIAIFHDISKIFEIKKETINGRIKYSFTDVNHVIDIKNRIEDQNSIGNYLSKKDERELTDAIISTHLSTRKKNLVGIFKFLDGLEASLRKSTPINLVYFNN